MSSENIKITKKTATPASYASKFLVAIAAFFAFNAVLARVKPLTLDAQAFPLHSWSWWTFKDLKESKQQSNVAILGSSLTVVAISECDAVQQRKKLDLSEYRQAEYFDTLLKQRLGGQYSTFNLSSPGQMPSDAYLTLKAAIQTGHRPDVVIYGVAPRDFFDGTLQKATDTEAYQFLRRVVNTDDISHLMVHQPLHKLENALEGSVYLYGNSTEIQSKLMNRIEAVSSSTLPQSKWNWEDRRRILPDYKPLEINAGQLYAMNSEATANMKEHLADYKARYRNPDSRIYHAQITVLQKLIQLCKLQDIELVLVNMPVQKENLDILKPALREQYLNDLIALSKSNGISFIDLCDFNCYKSVDYRDTVHLNGFGGKKFIEKLVDRLASDTKLRRVIMAASHKRGQVLAASKDKNTQ